MAPSISQLIWEWRCFQAPEVSGKQMEPYFLYYERSKNISGCLVFGQANDFIIIIIISKAERC